MKLDEIKQAVSENKEVYWKNEGYKVCMDDLDQWFIVCKYNGNAIGLTWRDGETLNGEEKDFYIR